MLDVVLVCPCPFIKHPSGTVRGSGFCYADRLHTSVSTGKVDKNCILSAQSYRGVMLNCNRRVSMLFTTFYEKGRGGRNQGLANKIFLIQLFLVFASFFSLRCLRFTLLWV